MNKRFIIVLLVAMALIVSVSAHAFQAAERNAPPAATKAKPDNVKTDIHGAGNIYFGNPRVNERATLDESFEGGAIPADWTVHNVDGGDAWAAYDASAEVAPYPGAHTGSYVARAYYDAPNDDWLVTPKLSVVAGDTLKFWASAYSSYFSEDFQVWVSTTGNAVGDFSDSLYEAIQIPQGWGEYKVGLDTYAGSDIYVAIRCISNNEFALYIDDVTGPEIWVPAGPAIAFNTSDIPFGTVPLGDSKDFDLKIFSVGASDLTVSGFSSDDGHFTDNFTGSTVLSPGDSMVVTVTFTPTAEPQETGTITVTHDGTKADSYITVSGAGIDALFYEDFAAGIVPPSGWAGYELGDPAGWIVGTPGYDDDNCAFHNDDNVTTGCDDWLVTSQITLPAKAVYQLEFMQLQNFDTYYEYHGIMISTLSGDPNDGDFVELAEVGAGTEDTWEAKEFSLAAYAGQSIYLAFRYTGDYADEWSVDNVAVKEFIYVNEPPVIAHDPKGDTDDTTPTLTAIITDVETFTATAYYETAKAFTPVTMTTTGNPNEFSVDLPIGANGTVNYYIEAEDDSKGLVATTATYSFDICPVVGTELIYDDGTVENATSWNPTYEDNRFAMRFTPPAHPCTLNAVKLGIFTDWPDEAHQQFAVEIYDDDGAAGLPSTLIYGPDTTGSIGNVIGGLPAGVSAPYPLYWAYVCIDPPVIITDGDFYVAKAQVTVSPECEGLDVDDDGTQYSRAYTYDFATTTWAEYYPADRNLMIRALTSQVITLGDLEGTVSEAKAPIAGAIVTAVGGLVTEVDTTDALGEYSFVGLPAGDYDVTAEAAGYHDQTVIDVAVVAGSTTIQNFNLAVDTALLRESFCGTFPPSGWAEYQLGDPAGWQQGTPGYDDACCAWHDDDNVTTGCDDWLVSPALSIPAGKANYGLTFQEYWSMTSYYNYHGLMVSTGSGDPNDGAFVQLMEVNTGAGYLWEEMGPISLAPYAGQTIYLAFNYTGDYADDWKIDDVVVDLMLTGNIGGNVATAKAAVQDAIVTAGGMSDTTDALGDYLIEGLGVGTYDVSCNATGYFPVLETDIDVTADATTTVNFTLSPYGLNDILLVDADGSAYYPDTVFTDVQAYFTDALTACGYTYDVWEKLSYPEDGPDATMMSYYDAVIWSCGEAWTGNQTLTANDEIELALYLDAGGYLFLDGQDYFYDVYDPGGGAITFTAGQFPYDYLGVSAATQDVIWLNTPSVGTSDGHAGSLADGLSYGLADPFTTKNMVKSDSKHPDGLTIDELTILDTAVLDADDGLTPITNGACQFEGVKGFKTVFSTVCFAGLTEDYGHTRSELMCAILDYFFAPPAQMWLSNGGVNPIIGNLSTTFTYSVTYNQISDVAPTVQNVIIDGTPYAMTDPTGGAGPYAGGVVFTFAHTFPGGGDHDFHFDFSDGTNTDRLPAAGELWGPMNGYYFFDFEASDGNFTPTGPFDDWQWGVPTYGPASAHSGVNCWGTQLGLDYSLNSQSRLETPSLDLTTGGGVHLELKFWHWYNSEGSYSPWDGGNVKIITPTDTTIITPDLALADDYDTYSMGTANAWIPGEPAYFGPVATWKEAIFDLTPWTTESDVRIVFDFGSDGSVAYPGWYIDDVVIWGQPPLPVELAGFAATAGDQVVTLSWETRSERNNLGFHVYRQDADGEFVRIDDERIPGAGTSEDAHRYTYVDKGLENGATYSYQIAAVDFGGNVKMHDVVVSATPTATLPTTFALSQNYPNPFNPNTEIKYQIPEDSRVALKIYNVMGQEVVTLMDVDLKAGYYTATWDARDSRGVEVSAGIYFCTLQAGEFNQTRKMVLLK